MQKNVEQIINQFKSANGIGIDENINMLDVYEWACQRVEEGDYFLGLLDYMEISGIKESATIEVGKGYFDSIVVPYETRLITPFKSEFSEEYIEDRSRIIEAKFSVINHTPALIFANGIRTTIENTELQKYMIHNPYSMREISDWDHIAKNPNTQIIIGAYGNTHDKDRRKKIDEIKRWKEKLDVVYKECYATTDDRYYYAIVTTPEKKLTLK